MFVYLSNSAMISSSKTCDPVGSSYAISEQQFYDSSTFNSWSFYNTRQFLRCEDIVSKVLIVLVILPLFDISGSNVNRKQGGEREKYNMQWKYHSWKSNCGHLAVMWCAPWPLGYQAAQLQSLLLFWQLTGTCPWKQGLPQYWLAHRNILEASSG